MNPPKIVSAGAGSGKTYRIVDEVERLVREDNVPIDRIGAITFTDAAAAELQERIRERLVEKGLLEAARRVDAAPIRTIHSFALSLLTDNPLEAGLSPSPLVLGEVESAALLTRAMNDALADPTLRPAIDRLTREYYTADLRNHKSEEDFLQEDAKRLAEMLRSLRLVAADRDRVISENATDLAEAFGPPGDAGKLDAALRATSSDARQFLVDYPNGTGKVGDAPHLPKLRAAIDAIFGTHPEGIPLRPLAATFTKWSRATTKLMPLLQQLTAGVDAWVRHHPRALERLQRDAADLLTVAFGVLDCYQAAKHEAGALDYEDMQAQALELLEKDFEGAPFASYVAARVTHLVVDEFQDSSPLQFRIAETLREHGTRVLYVGDPRQGIYGFRGADSRLIMALEETEQAAGRPPSKLENNWRSRPELVGFVNAVFGNLFPKVGLGYTALTPRGPYVDPVVPKDRPSIDRVSAKSTEALSRIQEILADDTFQVLDRRTKSLRRVRPGDIAILCPINTQLDSWAKALAKAGLRFVRELQGWSTALEVRLARAALAVLANPLSSADVAGLLVSEVYGLGQRDLVKLAGAGFFRSPRRLIGGGPDVAKDIATAAGLGEAASAALLRFGADFAALQSELRSRNLPEIVQAVIDRLALEQTVAAKGLGDQARANLVALVEHARAFVSVNERGLEALGASSTTVENFLFYVESVVIPSGDPQPEPLPEDDEAVKLVTYHGAKGLEWPVVVIPNLARSVEPDLPRMEIVRPEKASDLVGPDLFKLSRLRVFPQFLTGCPTSTLEKDIAVSKGGAEARLAEHARILYVALTRAREHLVVGWSDKPAPGSQQHMIAALGALSAETDAFVVSGERFATTTVEPVDTEPAAPAEEPPDREELRRALLEGAPLAHAASDFALVEPNVPPPGANTSPGELCHFADDPVGARLFRRGANVPYPVSAQIAEVAMIDLAAGPLQRVAGDAPPDEIGRIVHLALEHGDIGFGGPDDAALEKLLRGRVGERPFTPALVAYARAALGSIRALVRELVATSAAREVPFVLARGPHRITGCIDLALLTPAGWHVFDHKAHPIGREHVPRWAAFYRPQLEAYALALAELAHAPVVGRHLLFHTTGVRATYAGPLDVAGLDAALAVVARA